MARYLLLPKIGMNMEEAVIVEWLVQEGEYVEKEQMVVRAETDKAIQDLFATDSGILFRQLVHPGDVVPCQEKIGILVDEGERYEETAEEGQAAPVRDGSVTDGSSAKEEESAAEAAPSAPQAAETPGAGGRIRISPLARKRAEELGIDIAKLSPSAPGKRIVSADVDRCLREQPAGTAPSPALEEAQGEDTFVAFTRKRQIIAKRMTMSAQTKPRVSLVTSVDCTALIEWRTLLNRERRVGYNELIAKASAAALKKHPEMNALSGEGGLNRMGRIHIGVAVDTEEGLLVPVLRDADRKGALALAEEFAALVEKARRGQLTLEEMSGATFSISNLGMYGVESFDPIINAPECLILGVGCMKDTPVVHKGAVTVRPVMQISLVFDHASFDGAGSARLLQEIKAHLEQPLAMLA